MKVLLCVFFVGITTTWADMLGECDMAGFYKELGCTATPLNNSTKCPDSFICPDLHPDPKLCYYRGTSYQPDKMIPQAAVYNPCSLYCKCSLGKETTFQCAAVDCVETFDSDMEPCINTYDLDSCCSIGTVCGKDDIAKLKTCEVDGETYKEGQQFYPKNTRKVCVCTSQWNGTVDDTSYCKDINCGVEIHYQDNIMNLCAPVFLSSIPRGCPIGFKCPTNSSEVIRGVNLKSVSSQCVFGNMTLGVGDEVNVNDPCVKCTCEVPPFVTCLQGPRKDQETANC